MVSDIRKAIYDELGFTCSAGISVNKMAAKFIAGLKKPNAQSVLLPPQIRNYFKTVPIRKLRGLGGKLGADLCSQFNVQYCGQVDDISDSHLRAAFGYSEASFIRDMSRGIDEEPIKIRYAAESCGSGRNFLGVDTIVKTMQVTAWVTNLLKDLFDRLEEYKEEGRVPKKMTINVAWHAPNYNPHKKGQLYTDIAPESIPKVNINIFSDRYNILFSQK